MSTQTRARKLTVTAMLSTIAFILMYIEFPIPALIPSFVKLDISDLPELLAAFSLGPVYGVVVSLLKNVLFSLLHGTSSAYVGETFNFIMGAVFSFSAGFIYKKYKSAAIDIVKANPYRLCEEIAGVGFEKADNVGKELGFTDECSERLDAGIKYPLGFKT